MGFSTVAERQLLAVDGVGFVISGQIDETKASVEYAYERVLGDGAAIISVRV